MGVITTLVYGYRPGRDSMCWPRSAAGMEGWPRRSSALSRAGIRARRPSCGLKNRQFPVAATHRKPERSRSRDVERDGTRANRRRRGLRPRRLRFRSSSASSADLHDRGDDHATLCARLERAQRDHLLVVPFRRIDRRSTTAGSQLPPRTSDFSSLAFFQHRLQ